MRVDSRWSEGTMLVVWKGRGVGRGKKEDMRIQARQHFVSTYFHFEKQVRYLNSVSTDILILYNYDT